MAGPDRNLRRAWVVLVLAAVLLGCAGDKGVRAIDFVAPSGSRLIEGVPFFPQEAYQCGPASLAGVLQYYGDRVTPEEIAPSIFRKELGGAVTLDMVLYARQRGFGAEWYSGGLPDLHRAVTGDAPLIVMVDQGFAGLSRLHFMVTVGYRPEGVVVNSGRSRGQVIEWQAFLGQWRRTNYWTLRLTPKHGL
ncbi:MAG: C39 family peptidase [Pseudomonadota bacterium]